MPDPLLERLSACDNQLFGAAEALRKHVSPILRRIVTVFPHYTGHDDEHSEKVAGICEWLGGNDLLGSLNGGELFALHASIFLHDVGMAATVEEMDEIRSSSGFREFAQTQVQLSATESLAEWIRRFHNRRSADYIRRNLRDAVGLQIVEPVLFEAVALLAESHGTSDLADFDKFDPYFAWGTTGKTLRLPLLGVLLRLSDLLHLSNDRTPLPLVPYADLRNARSREEWKKHLATLGVAPIPDHRTVRMTCTCKDPATHRSILRLCDYVNAEFAYCHEILRLLTQRTGCEVTIKFDKIEPKVVPDGYEPWLHLHFQFDRAGIFQLLKGARLYPDPGAVVTELVINAVDATRQNFRVTGKLHAVEVRLDTSSRVLEVADRGSGMNRHEIESYLLQLGKSIYHADEYLQIYHPPQRIESISEFGIGFASAFAASNHVTVETCREGETPIFIDMFDLLGFAAARTGTLPHRGTIVRLKLTDSDEVLNSVKSAVMGLRTQFPHLEMQLRVTVDGETSILEFEPYEREPKGLLSEYFAGRDSSFHIHYHRFHPAEGDITGVIGLFCTLEEGVLVPGGPPWYQIEHNPGRRVSQLGFAIPFAANQHSSLLGDLNVAQIVYDLDLKGSMRIELDPSRTRLQGSAHNTRVIRELDAHLTEFLLETDRKYWRGLLREQRLYVFGKLAALIRTRVLRSARFNLQIAPLIDLLMESAPNKVYNDNDEAELMTWNEIRQLSRPVVFYRRYIQKSDEDVRREAAAIRSQASNCLVVEYPGGEDSFNDFADTEGIILCNALHRGFQIFRPWLGTASEMDERRRQSVNHLASLTPFHSECLYAVVSSTVTRESVAVCGRLNVNHPKIQTMLAWIRQCTERNKAIPQTLAFLSFINNDYIGFGRDPDYVAFVTAKQRDCLQELARHLQCDYSTAEELAFSVEDFVPWEINP